MLFGVKTEGQLGGRQELVEAYELFKATYVNDRVRKVERMINYLGSFNGVEGMELIPVEPITEQLSENAMIQAMTPTELREKAGLPAIEIKTESSVQDVITAINSLSPLVANKVLESMSPNEIRALVSLPPKAEGQGLSPDTATEVSPEPTAPQGLASNDNIKKLSGREYQNLMRIVRHYAQEKITLEMARTMLSAGFGLSAEEVNTLLGVQEQKFSNPNEPWWGEEDDESDLGWGDEEFKVLEVVASKFGSNADEYVVMNSRPIRFDSDLDTQVRQAFAELGEEEKELDAKIEAYRKKNRDASVEEMAKEFGVSKAKVAKRVAYLMNKDRYPIARAVDTIAKEGAKPTAEPVLEVRYKYAWAAGFSNADKGTSREFCKVMLDLADQGKVYTRQDIDSISSIMGYSVWNRRGGWYHMKNGVNRPQCRHVWEQQIVIRKGNKISKA
jgi:hypothetical protein